MKTEDTTAQRNYRWPLQKAAELIRAGHRALCLPLGRPQMSKAQIVVELEAMARYRLFNCRDWLADDPETIDAIDQKLMKMGLRERVSSNTWRNSPSGTELDVQLFEVFMGLFEVWDALLILKDYGLIDQREFDGLCECMSTDANPDLVLFGYVRRAYFDYHKTSRCLH